MSRSTTRARSATPCSTPATRRADRRVAEQPRERPDARRRDGVVGGDVRARRPSAGRGRSCPNPRRFAARSSRSHPRADIPYEVRWIAFNVVDFPWHLYHTAEVHCEYTDEANGIDIRNQYGLTDQLNTRCLAGLRHRPGQAHHSVPADPPRLRRTGLARATGWRPTTSRSASAIRSPTGSPSTSPCRRRCSARSSTARSSTSATTIRPTTCTSASRSSSAPRTRRRSDSRSSSSIRPGARSRSRSR